MSKYKDVKVSALDINALYHVHNIDKSRAKGYSLRFGQRFWNEIGLSLVQDKVSVQERTWPELYYLTNDQEAYKLIMSSYDIIYDEMPSEEIF